MKIYCVKCRKKAESLNSNLDFKTKNGRLLFNQNVLSVYLKSQDL